MRHYSDRWVQDWCDNNGWTELFIERRDHYWAFPPNAVMPEPIPSTVLRSIKSEKGLCSEEKTWIGIATALTVIGAIAGCWIMSPMPLVLAFAFDAITAAQLEVEY
jgi:hypothetical protein